MSQMWFIIKNHHDLQVWVHVTTITNKQEKLISITFPCDVSSSEWHHPSQDEDPLRSLYSLIWWRVFGSASTSPTESNLVIRWSSFSFIFHCRKNSRSIILVLRVIIIINIFSSVYILPFCRTGFYQHYCHLWCFSVIKMCN